MKITQSKAKNMLATIKVEVSESDYSESVNRVLKRYRKDAVVPGFRKGKTPMSIIEKQYKTSVIVDEVNKVTNSKNKLHPILTTHYERQYFISNQNKVRATVDYNLESVFLKNLSELQLRKKYFPECILELKYSTKIDRLVSQKLNEMTLRLSKNSKFVQSFFKRPKY